MKNENNYKRLLCIPVMAFVFVIALFFGSSASAEGDPIIWTDEKIGEGNVVKIKIEEIAAGVTLSGNVAESVDKIKWSTTDYSIDDIADDSNGTLFDIVEQTGEITVRTINASIEVSDLSVTNTDKTVYFYAYIKNENNSSGDPENSGNDNNSGDSGNSGNANNSGEPGNSGNENNSGNEPDGYWVKASTVNIEVICPSIKVDHNTLFIYKNTSSLSMKAYVENTENATSIIWSTTEKNVGTTVDDSLGKIIGTDIEIETDDGALAGYKIDITNLSEFTREYNPIKKRIFVCARLQ